MNGFLQVSTTTDSEDEARRIAAPLVDRRLAACAQIVGPITSVYRWKGKVETAGEWLCLIKTTSATYDDLEAAIREMHSYEVPEIVAVPLCAGSSDYLDWLKGQVNACHEPDGNRFT